MKNKLLILTSLSLIALLMLWDTDALAVKAVDVGGADAGLQTSADALSKLLRGNVASVILICGCVAGTALSFIKSTPAPFILTMVITVGFGFASSWIGSTYGVCV